MAIRKLHNYVRGEWYEPRGARWLDVENPSTGGIIAQVPLSSAEDTNAAIAAARTAFPGWATTPVDKRVAPLFKLAGMIRDNRELLARSITEENGKSLADARAEVDRTLENVETSCGMPVLQQGDKLIGAAPGIDGEVIRLPMGVFAMIAPFNFPGMVPFWFIPYALATGNTYVVKPSKQVPCTMQLLTSYIEACGLAPSNLAGALGARAGLFECGEVRVHPTGSVTVFTGSHSHGQGHETTFAQLIADRLGVPIGQVQIVHGDTDKVQFGMGTYGSRSIAVGGTAIVKAMDKVEAKAKKIASHLLEASEGDIVIENGEFKVTGTDKSIALPMVALAAYTAHNLPDGMEPGLKETAFYDPTNFTFPAGAYICELEVDPGTGKTSFVNFVAADDFGRLINPMIVEGQVHGGLAQGIGQALLESAVYDSSGQLVTASFMDYTMPRADDLPSFKLSHTTTLCPGNPLGVKGCGEAGAIGASAAVINAITDAIGNNKLEMPATPDRVWHAIQG